MMFRRAISSIQSQHQQCKTMRSSCIRQAQITHLLGSIAVLPPHDCAAVRNMHSARPINNIVSHSRPIILSSTMQTDTSLRNTCHMKDDKSFSTATASNTTTDESSKSSPSSSTSDKSQSKDGKSKKDDSNIFLDNLGKIFLSSIGLVLVMLLRSTKSNNSRSALREDIETAALLDPLEIDDLRLANSDFTIEVWEKIVDEIKKEFPGRDEVTYPEFLTVVMRVMKELKGEGFTIQFGHLVDRVVIAELERMGKEEDENEIHGQEQRILQNELPLSFLFVALSLALHSTVADRVRILYESMLNGDMDSTSAAEPTVSGEQVSRMVQHLQNTCQLVPEAQIVETNSKVPYQTFCVGTGDELVKRAREGFGGKKGSAGVTKEKEGPVSLEEFHAILKTRTVCAWGECYVKKSGMISTSDR